VLGLLAAVFFFLPRVVFDLDASDVSDDPFAAFLCHHKHEYAGSGKLLFRAASFLP
jgi:hypothetical protein